MTKADICSNLRPAASILPLTTKHKMTDKHESGRAYYNNYFISSLKSFIIHL